jgi:formate dehydrogenase major subunit
VTPKPSVRDSLELLRRLPLLRQLEGDPSARGRATRSGRSERLLPRTASADRVVPSICPYCAVGCSILLHVQDGRLVNLEGNPDSPINRGTLCPKGAASYQLTVNPQRPVKCLYRRPGGTAWEPIELDRAMDMVADRVKRTRDETFQRTATVNGREVTLNHTLGIGSLGGATIDNEWNYAQAKAFRGLGGVFLENQARI